MAALVVVVVLENDHDGHHQLALTEGIHRLLSFSSLLLFLLHCCCRAAVVTV
jgi:hypothetical protein